ncbi:MAG: hypothetical protein H6Q18_727, partial [Bacteroidetes bacterium]|nr:hypothetical protein [Bacteroidota bacterium]
MHQNVNSNTFRLLIIVLLLQTAKPVIQAQTVLLDPPEIYIGATGGMNGSLVSFNPTVNQSMPLIGYNGGLSFRYITEKHFGLQIEANYSQRGWTESNGLYSRRADYIELP